MPYRVNPNNTKEVQKQQPNGNWVREALHKSSAAAIQHLQALQINVEEA
jgi:hypothetical protein